MQSLSQFLKSEIQTYSLALFEFGKFGSPEGNKESRSRSLCYESLLPTSGLAVSRWSHSSTEVCQLPLFTHISLLFLDFQSEKKPQPTMTVSGGTQQLLYSSQSFVIFCSIISPHIGQYVYACLPNMGTLSYLLKFEHMLAIEYPCGMVFHR